MRAELKRKSTRTVHGEKIVRLRLDIPYSEVEEAEREGQDMRKWLDTRVDKGVNFSIGPFEDDEQAGLSEMEEDEWMTVESDVDYSTDLDNL